MRWTSPELDGTGEQIAAWAADTLAGLDADGLYVATPDAGAREAIAFWTAAHETGLSFAAPGAFPWTLANSPTGRISQRLGIRGPCTTYVGGDDAADEAWAHATDDLAAGVVTRALVVRLSGDRPVAAARGVVRVELDAEIITTPDERASDRSTENVGT
jgi:hypothetical protein